MISVNEQAKPAAPAAPKAAQPPGFVARMRNIFPHSDGRALVFGVDHTIFDGFIDGLGDIPRLFGALDMAYVDTVLASPESYRNGRLGTLDKGVGKVMRADATNAFDATPITNATSVSVISEVEVVRSGVDAVACFFLADLHGVRVADHRAHVAEISRCCRTYGYPLIVEALCLDDDGNTVSDARMIRYAARMANELGADVVKIDPPQDLHELRDIIAEIDCPVLMRGGAPRDDYLDTVREVEKFVEAGAAGIVFGRTVFQARQPNTVLRDLYSALHG